AMTQAGTIVREHIGRHGPALVSDLKTALGSSRRIMVPLLEKLDRDGITRREGDRRVVRWPVPHRTEQPVRAWGASAGSGIVGGHAQPGTSLPRVRPVAAR